MTAPHPPAPTPTAHEILEAARAAHEATLARALDRADRHVAQLRTICAAGRPARLAWSNNDGGEVLSHAATVRRATEAGERESA